MTVVRSIYLRAAVLVGTLFLISTAGYAATWTVEKDGSGDYMIIQEAIDAAASGDTILIGPGRYDDLRVHPLLLNGVLVSSILWVNKPGLSIVGSGAESTIIGPTEYLGEFETESTASLTIDAGSSCEVRDLWFENTRFEVNIYASSVMEDCKVTRGPFRMDHSLAVGYCSGVNIRRVELVNSGGVVTRPGASDLLVEDCSFEDESEWTYAIQLSNSPQNVTVRSCTIIGGGGAIQYSGTGLVEDCTMRNQWGTGLEVVGGGHMIARRCIIGPSRSNLWVSIGRLEVFDSLLEGGTRETIYSTAEIYVRNSHILNGGGWTVYGRTSVGDERIDVRNNWWGTSDPVQVEAWINDTFGTVLWEPFNDMPVPTRDSSIGKLKAGFTDH